MNLSTWMNWHRWAGLVIALLIALLCITGVLLNHGSALGLARQFVQSDWLLDLYGIEPVQEAMAFTGGGHWVSRIGDRLYFDDQDLAERSDALLGAVLLQDQIVAGLSDRLLILTPKGETVEILRSAEGVPAGMRRIGTAPDGRLVIDTAHGHFVPDLDTLRWKEGAVSDVLWAEPVALPAELGARLMQSFRAHALTLERVLLDLHSGRIINRFGIWIMDAVAVVLMSMVLSGLWIWYRRQVNDKGGPNGR